MGLLGVQIPAVEPMIAASLLVTGLLVITRWRMCQASPLR
jgi:urease accessory protein